MMSETEKENGVSDDFESWWRASKYCQVSHGDHRQVALDGWNAGTESLRQRVKELIDINYALEEQARALKARQGEPVAVVNVQGDGENPVVSWIRAYILPAGSHKLYTSAPTIPEGWQLVPVEPTKEMIDALALAKNSTMQGYKSLLTDTEFRNMAKAMLAAAPKTLQQAAHMPVKTYCGGKPNYCKEQE